MFRAVVFIALVAAVSADDDMKKCRRLLNGGGIRCCSKSPLEKLNLSNDDDIKECLDTPFKPTSCELEECIATKKGYYTSGGGLDMDALASSVEKEFKNSPELVAAVKENCTKDLSQYGPSEMCDLKKLKHCLDTQIMKLCDEWKTEGNCSGMKELFEECAKHVI